MSFGAGLRHIATVDAIEYRALVNRDYSPGVFNMGGKFNFFALAGAVGIISHWQPRIKHAHGKGPGHKNKLDFCRAIRLEPRPLAAGY